MGQSQDLNRSEVFKSLVFNNNKSKLCFKWYLLTTDKEARKDEKEGEGEEEKTFELRLEEFGRGGLVFPLICLSSHLSTSVCSAIKWE